jgi:hypothetical protein
MGDPCYVAAVAAAGIALRACQVHREIVAYGYVVFVGDSCRALGLALTVATDAVHSTLWSVELTYPLVVPADIETIGPLSGKACQGEEEGPGKPSLPTVFFLEAPTLKALELLPSPSEMPPQLEPCSLIPHLV